MGNATASPLFGFKSRWKDATQYPAFPEGPALPGDPSAKPASRAGPGLGSVLGSELGSGSRSGSGSASASVATVTAALSTRPDNDTAPPSRPHATWSLGTAADTGRMHWADPQTERRVALHPSDSELVETVGEHSVTHLTPSVIVDVAGIPCYLDLSMRSIVASVATRLAFVPVFQSHTWVSSAHYLWFDAPLSTLVNLHEFCANADQASTTFTVTAGYVHVHRPEERRLADGEHPPEPREQFTAVVVQNRSIAGALLREPLAESATDMPPPRPDTTAAYVYATFTFTRRREGLYGTEPIICCSLSTNSATSGTTILLRDAIVARSAARLSMVLSSVGLRKTQSPPLLDHPMPTAAYDLRMDRSVRVIRAATVVSLRLLHTTQVETRALVRHQRQRRQGQGQDHGQSHGHGHGHGHRGETSQATRDNSECVQDSGSLTEVEVLLPLETIEVDNPVFRELAWNVITSLAVQTPEFRSMTAAAALPRVPLDAMKRFSTLYIGRAAQLQFSEADNPYSDFFEYVAPIRFTLTIHVLTKTVLTPTATTTYADADTDGETETDTDGDTMADTDTDTDTNGDTAGAPDPTDRVRWQSLSQSRFVSRATPEYICCE